MKCVAKIFMIFALTALCNVSIYGADDSFSGINRTKNWEKTQLSDTFSYYTNDEIFYVQLSAFQGSSTAGFKSMLEETGRFGIPKIILDLRNNQGGIIDESIKIAGMLIPEGRICTIVQSDNRKITNYSSTKKEVDYEIVVLVNAFTASSAELLASSIKESGAGIVIGSQTYGKSSVQKLTISESGEEFSETVGKYLTRNGNDIASIGITPNVEILNEYKTSYDFELEELDLKGDKIILAVKQRLFLLGYAVKTIDINDDDNYHAWLEKFQYENGIIQTGILDTETISKLKELENTIVVLCDKQLEKAIEYLQK